VYSLEPNRHLVQTACQRFGLRNVVTSIDQLPQDQFDLIFANQVFEHIFDPIELINGSLGMRLRMGGHLVFTVPNFASWNRLVLGRRWVGYSANEHIWFFSKPTVESLFANSPIYKLKSVLVKSAVNTPNDNFIPRSIAKRMYYRTVMRVFEALGYGDQLMVTLQKAE
jgi:SAM-dependent methyltransferase